MTDNWFIIICAMVGAVAIGCTIGAAVQFEFWGYDRPVRLLRPLAQNQVVRYHVGVQTVFEGIGEMTNARKLADELKSYIAANDGADPEWSLLVRCEAALRRHAQRAPTSEEKELFAAATKIDLADAVKHIRNWTSYIDDHHRQKYADLMEAQAKLIAHFVNDGPAQCALDRDVIAQAIYETGMEPDNDATTWAYAMRISETWKHKGPDFADQAAMYQRSVDEALAQADSVISALSSTECGGK